MRVSADRSKGRSNSLMVPESGRVMPIIMRMELDLPDPFGPSNPNIVPASTLNVRPSTATFVSYTLRI